MKILSLFLGLFLVVLSESTTLSQNEFMLKDGDTVVFLGDSITQAASKPEGYISLIKLFCGVNGYEIKAVNAGISGHKSNDMLARLQDDVLSHNPDWVSISCGVNDVWHQFKFEPEGVELPDYKKNMTEIVNRCKNAGAKVLLLTATPIYENVDSKENQKLRKYNDFLRELAKEQDVLLCDLFATFTKLYEMKLNDEKLLTTDGVHMNPRGNRLMAREIIRTFKPKGWEVRRAENRWELIGNMQPMGEN